MSKYSSLRELHTAIADEVRGKSGTADGIVVEALAEACHNIPTGGGGGELAVESGTISVNSQDSPNSLHFQHHLGTTPVVVFIEATKDEIFVPAYRMDSVPCGGILINTDKYKTGLVRQYGRRSSKASIETTVNIQAFNDITDTSFPFVYATDSTMVEAGTYSYFLVGLK